MKTRLVQMIPFAANNPRLLPALIIYTVFFFILSVSGIWENVPVKRTDDIPPRTYKKMLSDTAKNTLYNFTIILYLPLLLPFRILGTFGTVLYSIISTYTDEFIHNILKIILLPFMVFNIIGRKFDKNHIQNRLRSLKAYFLQLIRNKKKDKSIKSKLKIYQQYTKELANIDGSFIRDYYFERVYKFLALLLQVVSFFTTYAGVELFFGNLFDLAPLFITLVIQTGLYITSVTTMKPGKKNPKKKLVMGLLALVSIIFSYVGLATLACPPEHDYQKAYQAYETAFTDIQHHLANQFQNSDSAAKSIQNEFLKLTGTIGKLDVRLAALQTQITDLEENAPSSSQISTTRSHDAAGQAVTTTTQTTSAEYTNYMNRHASLVAEESTMNQEKDRLLSAIEAATNITVYQSDGSVNPNINTELHDHFSLDNIKKIINPAEANGNSGTNNSLNTDQNQYKSLAVINNETLYNLGLIHDDTINPDIMEECIAEMELHNAITNITMPDWKTLKPSSPDNITDAKNVLILAGELFGADLNNSDMKELQELWRAIREYTTQNHLDLAPYLSYVTDDELMKNLETSQKAIDETPNILFIAFHRFRESGTNMSNSVICMLLAIFTDGVTVLLGWASARRSYSFLYVKSSKDYYDDIDELFGVIFKSMMQGFCISIRSGTFSGMDIDSFTQACISQINATAQKIHTFLKSFQLSECTTEMGYNLKLEYSSPDDIEDYLPIISVLIKTNLIKVMPLQQYRHLELEYYCAVKLPLWLQEENGTLPADAYYNRLQEAKDNGNVLLLRNKGENYLRENMCVEIEGEENAI